MNPNIIITLGLTERENEIVRKNFPNEEYELIIAETFTDVLALVYTTAIINADALTKGERETMLSYYEEFVTSLNETICWIGYPLPTIELLNAIKYYERFEQLERNIKLFLQKAHYLYEKPKNFFNEL